MCYRVYSSLNDALAALLLRTPLCIMLTHNSSAVSLFRFDCSALRAHDMSLLFSFARDRTASPQQLRAEQRRIFHYFPKLCESFRYVYDLARRVSLLRPHLPLSARRSAASSLSQRDARAYCALVISSARSLTSGPLSFRSLLALLSTCTRWSAPNSHRRLALALTACRTTWSHSVLKYHCKEAYVLSLALQYYRKYQMCLRS